MPEDFMVKGSAKKIMTISMKEKQRYRIEIEINTNQIIGK